MNREVFLCHISVFQDPLTAQLLFSYMGHRFVGKLKKAEDLSFKKKEFTRAYSFRVTDFPKPSHGNQVKHTYFREWIYYETFCGTREEITCSYFRHTHTHTHTDTDTLLHQDTQTYLDTQTWTHSQVRPGIKKTHTSSDTDSRRPKDVDTQTDRYSR